VKKEDTLQQTLDLIGSRLMELRKAKGYTSHEIFCYDFDLPRMQYWRMENGKTNVTLKSLHRVVTIHKITMEDFFNDLSELREKQAARKTKRSL
jgi:hypothetical protein